MIFLMFLFYSQSSWAFIDAVVSGARTVKDEAHNRIIENQLVQLIIAAKQNYDASMSIYKEVKRLNEGRGLVRNIASDLGLKAKQMAEEEKDSFEAAFAYRGDSPIDRDIDELKRGMRRSVERKGLAVVDRYGTALDQETAAYAEALKIAGERIRLRRLRGQAGRTEGVRIASVAPDLNAKAQGLELQAFSDSLEALNELVNLQLAQAAKEKKTEIQLGKEINEALKFLLDRKGVAAALEESFYMVRLSRTPALLLPTRRLVSRLVAMLLGLLLAAGLIYEFSQTKGFIPEVLGLPLVLVVFGLIFYDKVFVAYSILMDTMEQTISSGQSIASTALQMTSQTSLSDYAMFGTSWTMRGLSLLLGYMTWIILIVFLWVRFAFFCLIYAVGPLMIVCSLFEPLRGMTKGWLLAAVQVGLWGLFMRILVLVMLNSGISGMLTPSGSTMKPIFASLVVNVVFAIFSVTCPYFTHLLMSGHIAEKAIGTVSAGNAGLAKARHWAAQKMTAGGKKKDENHRHPS